MIIFIDESGIHRKDGKSAVALVYVVVKNLENIEHSIERTEQSLKITFFHWAKHIWKIRNKFLIALLEENFEVKVSIIDNPFNQKAFEESLTYLITERKMDKIIIGVCPLKEEEEREVWNEGVIGLVAGKLCDKYYRPVLVITKGQEGYKGSGRSIPEFNIIAALEEGKEFLERYGGHPAACGFSLKEGNIKKFTSKIKEIAKIKLAGVDLRPKLEIEAELGLEEVSQNLVKDIASFSPFGQDNPRPKFISQQAQIKDIINMGIDGQHIKFRFNGLWALAFGRSEEWKDFKIGDRVDIVYYVENNNFNGRSEVQLKLIDIRNVTLI